MSYQPYRPDMLLPDEEPPQNGDLLTWVMWRGKNTGDVAGVVYRLTEEIVALRKRVEELERGNFF